MEIAVIGLNHLTAPIAMREKVSFTDSQKIEFLNQLLDEKVKEVVVLSTCNRSEIYICGEAVTDHIAVIKRLYEEKANEVSVYLFEKVGAEAVRHLYQVTAGLSSIVIGEDQILGQVKEAHEFAMEIGASGKVLNKLFREAITTAKQIKTETRISEYPLSISYIGVKFLKEKMGTLKGKKALLIGAGKMNQLALKHLYEEEIGEIYVANRTSCKVDEMMLEHKELRPVPYEKRYDFAKQVDLMITSTASPHVILKERLMPELSKSLYILDIALPRDVEERIATLPHVHLYDIDDLKEISNKNSTKRNELAEQAEEKIGESLDEFMSWLHTQKIDPTLKGLHERCEEIHTDTMHIIRRKMDLTCKEEKLIEKMLMSSLKRLIREPINNLKEIKDKEKQEECIRLIEELFDL